MSWEGRTVLVTGGASFIGSRLTDALVELGARVRVADDLSSGRFENIRAHVERGSIEFVEADLRDPASSRCAVRDVSHVFHLAADHGGRGYVDLHQADCATNLLLDGVLFEAVSREGVEKVIYASSGCVYPNSLQQNPDEELFLREEMVGPPYEADNMYGWAKLMGEMTLRASYADRGLKSACCRLFTVYGPRGVENHAVMAMIARAHVRQRPFVIWGNGEQIRNWTYVDDIVRGLILAAERIDDGTAVNLGTMRRIRVRDAAMMIMKMSGHDAPIETRPEMPTGPYNRVADNTLARKLLGWEPLVPFEEGVRRTIDWYESVKDRDVVASQLDRILLKRGAGVPAVGEGSRES